MYKKVPLPRSLNTWFFTALQINFLRASRELTPEIEKKFTNLVKSLPKGSKIRDIESLKNGELIISGRQIMNEAGELGAKIASR